MATAPESASSRRLSRPLKSRARSPVGQPLAVVSNRKVLLASLANGLSRRSNVMTDDFVNRLAGGAEKKKVVHCHVLSGCRWLPLIYHNPDGRFEMLRACNNPNNSTDRKCSGDLAIFAAMRRPHRG
jgi:hypothetical protein